MSLSKKRAIELHRKLWHYLFCYPKKDKDDWPRWKNNGGKYLEIETACFLCEYTNYDCDKCPLKWPKNLFGYSVCDGNGLFNQWKSEKDLTKRQALAKQIRDLPVQ